MKYTKKVKIAQNFEIEFSIISQVPPKKFGPKIIIKKFAECRGGHLAKYSLPSAGPRGHLAKLLLKNEKKIPSA
jgi:hypothetical protein